MAELFSLNGLASFAALTFLEIVLSVDNVVFVAIAAGGLPAHRRALGLQLGLWLALGLRVLLLAGVVWITRLDLTLFTVLGRAMSIKDLVLIGGGLFLIYKGSTEIHDDLGEGDAGEAAADPPPLHVPSLPGVVLQIGLINIVFSLDSVITAVGMTNQFLIMAAAVSAATLLMMVAAKAVGDFIARRPSAKMLGLAFILLVGVVLIADGTGLHVPRGYLYFAIAFSLAVEVLNSLAVRKRKRARTGPGPSTF